MGEEEEEEEDFVEIKTIFNKTESFEEIIKFLFCEKEEKPPKITIEIPKRSIIPHKKRKIERRGRKPKPREEDKTKKLYEENMKKNIYIFSVQQTLMPENPPFWV